MSKNDGGMTRADWQAAFAGGLDLCFVRNEKDLLFEREVLVAEEPERVGFVLIKKQTDAIMDHVFGRVFRRHNIIEFARPDKDLSMDELWRSIGFAGFYRDLSGGEEVSPEDITVSIFCDRLSEENRKRIEGAMRVENPEPGIHYIKNSALPTIQIVEISQIKDEDEVFAPLKLLSKEPSKMSVRAFLSEAAGYDDPEMRKDAYALLDACATLNMPLFEKMREEKVMSQALKEIMSEEFAKVKKQAMEEGVAKGRALGRVEGKNEGQKALVAVIRDLKKGATEAEILSNGYEANTLSLAKSVL